MQWIHDTRMEEDTPKGEGEFNAKDDKEIISLDQKYPFFPLLQLFLSSPSLSWIFYFNISLLGTHNNLWFMLKYCIYSREP